LLADRGQLDAVPGTQETIVANLDEALGQDVLQEAMDELLHRQGTEFGLAGAGCVITKGDLVVL
jgi:hypothetical protein